MNTVDVFSMEAEYEHCRVLVEERLDSFFIDDCPYNDLLHSMRYSLLASGKRLRPIICLKFFESAGGGNFEKALDAACAIEMLHTYTLIHDDLPCMDDDDMRRGLPSNHVKFGLSTATLAGDALQAAAFETLICSDFPPAITLEMTRILAKAAGVAGICGGQYLDLQVRQKDLFGIKELYRLKTSALISAAAGIGVAAAAGSKDQIYAAKTYSDAIGLAFQIRDDLLDFSSTPEKLGKPILSDKKNEKTTFACFMSPEECEKIISSETTKAIAAVRGKFQRDDFLVWLAHMLAERRK